MMTFHKRILNIPIVTQLLSHLREPLYRNGYALVFSSASASALGMIYWIAAARTYPAGVIGLNSAVISAMIFLANLSHFNLMNVLNRFLPNVNRPAAARMIASSYLVSFIAAVVSSQIFIRGVSLWAPELSFLESSAALNISFTAAVIIWCIFVLQDSAMTGLRQSIWVPVENLFFAATKIALLFFLSTFLPSYGVFGSWVVSALITLLPTNFLIFGRLLLKHQAAGEESRQIGVVQIIKYIAGDYFGSLVSLAAISLLPIVIVAQIGAEANAYFYLSWTIAYALYLVSRNMGMSFIAEVSADQSNLKPVSYRLFINTARLIVPVVAVILIFAPLILRLFGEEYAVEGVTLLRLLCLSAIPNMVVSIYTSIVRVQRRVFPLFVSLTLPYILVICFSFLLMKPYGIIGVGIAWLAGQSLFAMILFAAELRFLWAAEKIAARSS